MRQDLIVFGEDWGKLPSSTQHLIKHIATERKVIWVNSIGLRKPKVTWHDLLRLTEKVFARWQATPDHPSSCVPENMTVINPVTVPVPKWTLTRKLCQIFLKKQIVPVTKRLQLQSPILWLSLPTAVDMVGHLNEEKVVYYCGDDFAGLAGVDHDIVSKREDELLHKADVIFVSSQALAEKLSSPKTFLIPHGVDFQLFAKPKMASELLPRGKPIAGFYGSISAWLDLSLLCEVIAVMPHWHFVFVGKVVVDVSRLTQFSNVFFYPEVPHHELPTFSQHWNVSILPFVDNAQIRACNPLKLREYLATGTPIISSDFPALAPYRHVINVIRTPQEMCEALNSVLLKARTTVQQRLVECEDWAVKAQQVMDILANESY